jgi:integrase
MNHPDDPEDARFAELNALAGVLPYHRRDELSALLSDADVSTLRHLVESGPVFRRIDQWENIRPEGLTDQGVNLILKRRIAMAGLDPVSFSAHGLRSGFLTEAARQGVPLPEAMAQSQHTSVQQAARYYRSYNDAKRRMGRAARLLG